LHLRRDADAAEGGDAVGGADDVRDDGAHRRCLAADQMPAFAFADLDVLAGAEFALHGHVGKKQSVAGFDAHLLGVGRLKVFAAAQHGRPPTGLVDGAQRPALDQDAAAGFELGVFDHAADFDVAAGANAHARPDVTLDHDAAIEIHMAAGQVHRRQGDDRLDHDAVLDGYRLAGDARHEEIGIVRAGGDAFQTRREHRFLAGVRRNDLAEQGGAGDAGRGAAAAHERRFRIDGENLAHVAVIDAAAFGQSGLALAHAGQQVFEKAILAGLGRLAARHHHASGILGGHRRGDRLVQVAGGDALGGQGGIDFRFVDRLAAFGGHDVQGGGHLVVRQMHGEFAVAAFGQHQGGDGAAGIVLADEKRLGIGILMPVGAAAGGNARGERFGIERRGAVDRRVAGEKLAAAGIARQGDAVLPGRGARIFCFHACLHAMRRRVVRRVFWAERNKTCRPCVVRPAPGRWAAFR
jgi:hypothetical protein